MPDDARPAGEIDGQRIGEALPDAAARTDALTRAFAVLYRAWVDTWVAGATSAAKENPALTDAVDAYVDAGRARAATLSELLARVDLRRPPEGRAPDAAELEARWRELRGRIALRVVAQYIVHQQRHG